MPAYSTNKPWGCAFGNRVYLRTRFQYVRRRYSVQVMSQACVYEIWVEYIRIQSVLAHACTNLCMHVCMHVPDPTGNVFLYLDNSRYMICIYIRVYIYIIYTYVCVCERVCVCININRISYLCSIYNYIVDIRYACEFAYTNTVLYSDIWFEILWKKSFKLQTRNLPNISFSYVSLLFVPSFP